jgi:protein-L-isoaspartate(D-aspartate) O-methyltransferase
MEFDQARQDMVEQQLVSRGITDERVLDAMAQVPRHLFVPEAWRDEAYADKALPLEDGQTISQPYVVALMAQALRLKGDERLLEIGSGSGYAAAVLSLLVHEVYAVEVREDLAESAEQRLKQLGYHNVQIFVADGSAGLPAYAPYDAISVAAAAPWVPKALREQLSNEGRIIIPVGGINEQLLLRLKRYDNELRPERLNGVRFVPLVGEFAWKTPDGKK